MRSAIEQGTFARHVRAETASIRERFASLTPREREVLTLLVSGHLNKQIAATLGIVEQTVKFHRARIMERMEARTVAELMHIAARLGIGTDHPLVAVVDDEAGVRTMLRRVLRQADFEVAVFASGEDFLASLALRVPACVILDVHMLGLSGFYASSGSGGPD